MPEFWERPEFKKLVKDLKDKDPERQQRKEELRNPTEDAYSFFGASPPSSEQGMPHPGLYPPPTEGRPYTPSGQEAASAVSRLGEQGLPDWLRPSGGSEPEDQEGLPPWIRAPDDPEEGPQGMPHPGLYKPKVKPFDFGLGEIAEVAQSYRQEVQEALADTRSGRVGPTTGLARLGKAWWDSARSLWTRQDGDDDEQTWITKEDPETGATFVQPVDVREPAPMMRFISSAWMFPKGLVGRTIGGDDPESKVQEQRLRMFAQGIHVPLKLFEAGWNSGHGWLWGLLLGKKPNGLTEIREDLIRDAVRIKQQPVQQRLFGLPFLEAAKDAGGSLLGLWFQNMRGEFGEWNEDVLKPALEEYRQINREYQELTKNMDPMEELALRTGFRRSQITEDEFREIIERNTTEVLGQDAMTPGGAFGALAELARKDPALDVPPQVARGAAEMVQATSNMLWVPGQERPPITFPNPLTQSEAYADAMFEAQQNGWVTPEYNLELFMRGARRVGEYISAVDPDFSYTWLLDDDAHESYQEAKEQVEAQTGQSLTFWQARRLKEHYENPVTEMIGEAIFDLTWMVPDSIWEATFKTLSLPLRLTGNVGFRALKRIPLVGGGIKWLTKETTLSQGRVLGFKASEIFGSIYQASSDSRAFVNTVQEVAELNTVPSTIGSRQLRLMREVGKYIGPDEWATVADDAVQHALEVEKKRLARAGASADEIARAQPDPVEVVSHIADTFEARFIDEAQQAMDDRLVSEASEALGNAANWLRKAWIEQILSVRPGFAAINYMDSAFRVLVMGANPWADIEHIEATTLIPRSLRERFLATEADAALPIGQMPTGGPFGYMWHETGTSVFDDLPWPLGKRPWTRSKEAAEGFAANHPKANWLLRRFNMANWAAGWKEFNTAFEYALSARLYHELYWTKFFELDTRIGREIWERVLSDETTRNLARRIWNEAGDNPAQIETLVTEALEGKQVQGRPMWTLLVPPEVHDWLRGMPHDQQQILIKKTILDLRSGLADAADDAARRSSINKVFEDLRQAFAEEYDVHRQARAADDAMRGKDMVDPHAAARASTGDTPDDLGEEVESRLRAISGEAEPPPDRPGGALGQVWDAYDNQLDAPLTQDPAGLQRTPKNGVRMIREAAEKDLGVDELWINLDADMKESLRQIGSDHGMGPKEALAEILANPNEELTIVERAGIENLADELEEVRPPRMSQEDLNTLNQGGPEAERLRTERELVEAEARLEAQNLTTQATDDELMESMGLSNKERIWMGENPSPTFDNGAQDYAAQEWLRRHPEPSGAPGTSTSAETIAARVDELMEEGVPRQEATRRAVDEAIDASSVEGGRPIEPLSDRPSVDTSTPEGRREVLDRLEEELAEVKGPRSEAREAMEEVGQQAREEFGKLHDELSETAATQEVSQDYWVVWDDIEQMRSRMHDFLYKVWPGPGRMRNTPSQVWDAYYSLRRQLYEADVQIARQLRRSLDTGEARFLRRMSPVDYLERAGFRLNFDESGRLLSLEDVNSVRRKTPLETTDAMEKLEAIMLRDAPEGHSLQDPFHGRQPPPAAGGAGPAPSDGGAPRTGPRPGPEPPTPATPPDEVNDRGFSVQEIRTEDVKLSPDFQPRDTSGEPMQVDNRRIRELAQQWDWKHYEPIKVNVVQDDAAEYAADVAPGDVVMMGGHHRLGAAREAEIDQLPAQVYRLTHDEAQYVANIDNMVRQDQTPWEKGQIFSSRVALGDSETDLARIVYNDPNKAGLVAKYASLNELAPSVGRQVGQSTWFSEKHGFSLADAVIKYDISPEAQQQIVNRYLAEIQPSVTMLRQFLETYGPKAQQAKQLGLFEISETWLDEFAEVQERLRTMRGSAQSAQRIVNNPELADQLGVDIEDAKKVVDELQEQEAELRRISGLDPTQPVSTQDVGEVVDDAVQGAGEAAEVAEEAPEVEEGVGLVSTDLTDASGGRTVVGAGPPGPVEVGSRVSHIQKGDGTVVEVLDPAPNGADRVRVELDSGETTVMQGTSFTIVREEVADEAAESAQRIARATGEASEETGTRAREYVEPEEVPEPRDGGPSVAETEGVGEARPEPRAPREAERPVSGEPSTTTAGGGLAQGKRTHTGVTTIAEDSLPQPGEYVSAEYLQDLRERSRAHWLAQGVDEAEAEARAIQFMEHQVDNANRAFTAFDRGHGFVIADSTGTGKTYSAALIADQVFERGGDRVLVVAPSRDILGQWGEVLEQMGIKMEQFATKEGIPGSIPAAERGIVYGTTYATMNRWAGKNAPYGQDMLQMLGGKPADLIIFDESHYLKNWYQDTKRANVGVELAQQSDHALFMSATALESPLHYGYLADALGDGGVGSFDEMLESLDIQRVEREVEYTTRGGSRATRTYETYEGVSPEKLAELNTQLVENYSYIRHEMSYSGIYDRETGELLHAYTASVPVPIDEELADMYERFHRIADKHSGGRFGSQIEAQRTAIGRALLENAKVPEAAQLAQKKVDEGKSVALFVWRKQGDNWERHLQEFLAGERKYAKGSPIPNFYQDLIDAGVEIKSPIQVLQETFPDAAVVSGDVTGQARTEAIERFNQGRTNVMIVTIDAGGVGLSLHDKIGDFPRVQINLTTPYTALAMDQVAGRTFRMGSQSNAEIYWLYVDTPLEKKYVNRTIRRSQQMGALIGGHETLASDKDLIEFTFTVDDVTAKSPYSDLPVTLQETGPVDIDRYTTPPWEQADWEPDFRPGFGPEEPTVHMPPEQPVVKDWPEQQDGRIFLGESPVTGDAYYQDPNSREIYRANEPGQGMRWESTYGGWDDSGRGLAFPDHANQVRQRETLSDLATDREEILADLRDLERRKQSLLNEAQDLKEAGGKSDDVGNLNTEASAISDRQAELLTAIGEDVDDATLERLVYPLGEAADDLQQVRIPGGPWGAPETVSIEEAQDRLFDLEMYLNDPDAAAAGGAAELAEARTEASALEDAIRKAQGEAAPSAGETPVQTMRNMAAQRDALTQRMDNLPEQTIMEIEDKGFVPEELAGRWELTDVDGDLFWRKVDTDRFEPHGRFRNYLIDEAGVDRAIAGDHSYILISEYGPGVVSTDAGPQFSMLRDDVKPQDVTLETDEMQQAWRLEARKRGWLDKWGEEAEDYDTFIRALQKDRERIANTMGEAAAADADAMIEEAKSVAQTIQQSFGTQDAFFIANIPWWMKVPGERALQEASEDALAQYHAAMRGLDNWEAWLLDEQNLIAPALTDEQAEQLSRWGQEAIEAKRQVRDTARHGGQLLGSNHRGAEPETLRVMINYAMESNLDSILKHPFPFIKFPTRSIPAWIEIIGTHPEVLAWWMRYRTMSERYAFQHGAVDSQGRQLNRLRGYVPVPGTDLWWNPTAPLSARVVLPNDRTIYGIQEQGEQTPIQRAVNFLYGRGRIFGFNPAPWYEIPLLRMTGLIDTDRYPTRAVVPAVELVPPWWQRSILTGLRKTVYPNAPDLWEPEVSWKDYLVEQRMLEQAYQAVLEAPPEEQYAVAERYEQALLDREESQLWRDARREVEESEYYHRLFGFYTGVYPKQFTDAEAELLRMRNNINFLRDSIDDEINASLFGLSPDAEVRREGWMDERYNTPEGIVYNAVSTTRWTVVPGEGQLHGAERRKYIGDQIRTDIATRSLFEEIGNINDEMQQALAALPRGAPWELKQPIFEEFGKRRSNARNRHPDARKSAGLSGFTTRTEEQLQEYWVGLWYDILLETKPQYNPDQENFSEYEQRVLEWESELPQIAEATLPAFMREATTVPRPETLPDFTAIADPEIMEAYDMRDDTPVEALDRVWEENYWSEYWDEIEGLEGYERDLAEMRFKMRWPNGPSDQQLLTWVQDRYGDQFTKKQLQDVLRSGAMNIDDRIAVGRSELEQQGEQVWTLINWVGPSKTKLREAYLAAGGDEDWWDYWWKSDGTPGAFPESDWSRFYEHMMIAGNNLELKKPSQETMEEWAYVDQINRDFKERARVRFGEDIFSVSAAYAQTPFSQRAEFRQTHPELTAFWDFRDQWTADHPLWAQYYRPDALKKPSTGGSGRFSGSRSGGAGAPAAPTEPETTYRIAPTSYRSSQYARDLLGEGLGTGGYGGIVEWPGTPPPRFEEEVPIEVLEDIQSSQENGEDMPENTKTYLNTIYQNHPAWRHYIKKLLSGAPLGSRAPKTPNAREDLLERDLKRRVD